MDHSEVRWLFDILNRFRAAGSSGALIDQRKEIQIAWIEILKSCFRGQDKGDIESLTFPQIGTHVFGLRGASGILKDCELWHNTDPGRIDDPTFQSYVDQIDLKAEELRGIINSNNSNIKYTQKGREYYWITQDLLP